MTLLYLHGSPGGVANWAVCSSLPHYYLAAVWLCVRTQRDYLLGKMKEVEQKLSASKGVRQATERERRLASAANKLKVQGCESCIPLCCCHTLGLTLATAGWPAPLASLPCLWSALHASTLVQPAHTLV